MRRLVGIGFLIVTWFAGPTYASAQTPPSGPADASPPAAAPEDVAGSPPVPAAPVDPLPVTAYAKVDKPECSVGQRVRYEIELSWNTDGNRGVIVLPFDPPQAAGLDPINQSQKTTKALVGQTIRASIITAVDYRCAREGSYTLGPFAVPYDDGSGDKLSSMAPAVPVVVKPTLVGVLRGGAIVRYGVFAGGLIAFWIVALALRRRRRRKRTRSESATPAGSTGAAATWDGLRESAREPDADFYHRLERLLWDDLYAPGLAPDGSASVRLGDLRAAGASDAVIARAREAAEACQRGQRDAAVHSPGDALEAVRLARAAVEARQRERSSDSENDHATAP